LFLSDIPTPLKSTSGLHVDCDAPTRIKALQLCVTDGSGVVNIQNPAPKRLVFSLANAIRNKLKLSKMDANMDGAPEKCRTMHGITIISIYHMVTYQLVGSVSLNRESAESTSVSTYGTISATIALHILDNPANPYGITGEVHLCGSCTFVLAQHIIRRRFHKIPDDSLPDPVAGKSNHRQLKFVSLFFWPNFLDM
jgi:hypothetical protein